MCQFMCWGIRTCISSHGFIWILLFDLSKHMVASTRAVIGFMYNKKLQCFFSLISEIKRIWIRFTCVSLFHYKILLLFFRFFSLIFDSNFSLRFTLVIFALKRNEAKRNSSLFFCFFSVFFAFFSLFSLFFAFFRFFHFQFFASL